MKDLLRGLVVLNLKTGKVISSYQFEGYENILRFENLSRELLSWRGWNLTLVSYRKSFTIDEREPEPMPLLVAAMKKNRVIMTGLAVVDEDVATGFREFKVARSEKGLLVHFSSRSSVTDLCKKITLNKREVNSANIKKLKV